ncbi:MAG TPA: hypothetical protein VFC44_08700 [Candidatus Saccharimonadales bacterium]|nr:hypothetical protein [Candidatus Saccharimonadales bacterium]
MERSNNNDIDPKEQQPSQYTNELDHFNDNSSIASMGIVYRYPCPKCSRISDFSEGAACLNPTKNGGFCGYAFPHSLLEFNGHLLKKVAKHTQEPSGVFSGQISFNPSTGFYLENLSGARTAGDIYLDPKNGYFCTYITPSGNASIATLCSGNATNQFGVSGYKMPLNSRIQNIHGHYANVESGMRFVAHPIVVVVEYPCFQHPNEFRVLQSGNVIAAWNTGTLSGFVGHHVAVN